MTTQSELAWLVMSKEEREVARKVDLGIKLTPPEVDVLLGIWAKVESGQYPILDEN